MIHLDTEGTNSVVEETAGEDDLVSIRVNAFHDESAADFRAAVEKAHYTGQPIIPVQISSYGGRIDACIQMREAAKESNLPVLTYVPDRAYSCGFALLAFGTEGYRYVGPNAFTMAHQAKGGVRGKHREVRNKIEFFERHLSTFYSLLDQACGKPEGFFQDRWDQKDNLDDFLGPKETVELGAADAVGRPVLTADVSVNWKVRL